MTNMVVVALKVVIILTLSVPSRFLAEKKRFFEKFYSYFRFYKDISLETFFVF